MRIGKVLEVYRFIVIEFWDEIVFIWGFKVFREVRVRWVVMV